MNKPIYIIILVFLFISCQEKNTNRNTCAELEKIINNVDFLTFFQLCNLEDDIIVVYNSGEGEDKDLTCTITTTPCRKKLYLEIANSKKTYKKLRNPKLVYTKKGNEYHFLQKDTKLNFTATVTENGEVEVLSYGVY